MNTRRDGEPNSSLEITNLSKLKRREIRQEDLLLQLCNKNPLMDLLKTTFARINVKKMKENSKLELKHTKKKSVMEMGSKPEHKRLEGNNRTKK